MTQGLRIEGFAIVSSNGMIAASDGLMPDSLKFEADQGFLDRALDEAALLVHGRMSHECQENSCNRRRLLLTRTVQAFSAEPVEPNVWLWNPEATPFDTVCATLGVVEGVIAVLGGTRAYDMFLPRYAAFHLMRAGRVALPDGVPVLSGAGERAEPDAVLHAHGLRLVEQETLDPAHDLVRQKWTRRSAA